MRDRGAAAYATRRLFPGNNRIVSTRDMKGIASVAKVDKKPRRNSCRLATMGRSDNRQQPYDRPGAGSCTTCRDERVTFVVHDNPDPQDTSTV
jgi:hypothetical protein